MNKPINMLIAGGDNRTIPIIQHFSNYGINLFVAGFDSLDLENDNVRKVSLGQMDFSILNAILLPVSGTDSSGYIESTYSDKTIRLTEQMLANTPNDFVIYTGISTDYLDNLVAKTGRKLVRIFKRDDIAIYNSIPTAEATLQIAMQETTKTIHGSNVIIIGFGRIGLTIARIFSAVGANVTATARRTEHFARMYEMGISGLSTTEIENNIDQFDICINTVPHLVLDSSIISKMKANTLIIDLASKPGGTDFDFAKKQNINAIHALGLPGKVAPETAGEIIGKVLLEMLVEEFHLKS